MSWRRAFIRGLPPALVLAGQVFLIGGLPFAQPGLCPCWLLADARHIHPHPFTHPERPHDHGYLFALFSSTPAQTAPAPISPMDLLERLRSGLSSSLAAGLRGSPLWTAPPSFPPPRLFA